MTNFGHNQVATWKFGLFFFLIFVVHIFFGTMAGESVETIVSDVISSSSFISGFWSITALLGVKIEILWE